VDIVKNPARYKSSILYQNEDVIILEDKYPKAKIHLLCLPTEIILDFKALDISKVGVLKNLREAGSKMVKS